MRLQQAAASDDAEWIYVHVIGQWAAKRTPTDPALYPPEPPEPRWVKIIGAFFDTEVASGLGDDFRPRARDFESARS